MSDEVLRVRRIISGGQTGADRAGLDVAIELGLDHGGFCPRNRRAEDGRIPARYALTETDSIDYAERTRRNVQAADATVVFCRGAPAGGSLLTERHARRLGRPLLVIDVSADDDPSASVRDWLIRHQVHTLNVAGSRESGCPGIGEWVRQILRSVFVDAR